MIVILSNPSVKSRAVIRDIFNKAVEKAVVAKWFLYCKRDPKNVTLNISGR